MTVSRWMSLTALAMLIVAVARPDAADAIIQGVISDSAGKPIRGALVKVSVNGRAVSRYSSNDGRYELPVAPGKYDIVAEAYGFAAKRVQKDSAEAGPVNFTLTPGWTV